LLDVLHVHLCRSIVKGYLGFGDAGISMGVIFAAGVAPLGDEEIDLLLFVVLGFGVYPDPGGTDRRVILFLMQVVV
jgi:hypothetical protein